VKTKFENTLVVDGYDEKVFLKAPAGIGITHSDSISDNLQSKYIYIHKPKKFETYQLVIISGNNFLYQKRLRRQ
jgi:hypothetical protein